MKKVLSMIALGGLIFVIYKAFKHAQANKKDIKLVER